MKIIVNGKNQEVNKTEISVYDLLSSNKVENLELVSIQLNGEFVIKEELHTALVKENDEVDFLYFMGGGKQQLITHQQIQ